jgi:magnesium chelatase family protein
MSVLKIKSSVLCGVEIHDIEVHALRLQGFSGIQILGLPLDWSRDIRERLRGCLESHGFNPNQQRILIEVKSSVSLKWVRSPSSLLDLPILLGVIHCLKKQVSQREPQNIFALGEVLLDGEISCRGEEIFLEASACRQSDQTICYLPSGEFDFTVSQHANIKTLTHVKQIFDLKKETTNVVQTQNETKMNPQKQPTCPAELNQLQKHVDQMFTALPIAINTWLHCPQLALAHILALSCRFNLLIVGSPGVGKTHSTHFWTQLLPPLSESQRRDRRLIDGQKKNGWDRPFRTPHHSCSTAGLTGGAALQPGELTFAHHGVLFLDELLEFGRDRLETLREPMESRLIHLAKASGSVSLPAHFQLLACSNPCKCGHLLSKIQSCRCPARDRAKAWEKISGPLLDRFELKLVVDNLNEDCAAKNLLRSVLGQILTNETKKSQFIDSFLNLQSASFDLCPETTNISNPAASLSSSLQFAPSGIGSVRAQVQEGKILSALKCLFDSPLKDTHDELQRLEIFHSWRIELRSLESVLQKQILGDCP